MRRHCVGHTLLFSWEATPLQHNLTYLKFFSAGLIDKTKKTNKETSCWYTFRLLNFIFHHLLITYNSIILTLILKFLPLLQHLTYDFQIGSAMRFFKNAFKMQYAKDKKSHVRSWEGAREKCASIHPGKKWRRSPKKINLLISDAPEIKWVIFLFFFCVCVCVFP